MKDSLKKTLCQVTQSLNTISTMIPAVKFVEFNGTTDVSGNIYPTYSYGSWTPILAVVKSSDTNYKMGQPYLRNKASNYSEKRWGYHIINASNAIVANTSINYYVIMVNLDVLGGST